MFGLSLRLGLRSKLLLLASILLTIPWLGYQYVWEMEKYLRFGQEQTLVGTARALATALHERDNLFNNQASFLPSVKKGRDLYGFQINNAIQLDGLHQDWPDFKNKAHFYGVEHQLIAQPLNLDSLSLHFTAGVAKYDKYLYLQINAVDDHLIYRGANTLSIYRNDHLELALVDNAGNFNRYIISNKADGWLDAYQITNTPDNKPSPAPLIQGQWLETEQGYNIELRLPLSLVGDKIAFALHDVDQVLGDVVTSLGSADPSSAETLGTILVPSPEIERIVLGMSYTNSAIWVVDQHHRVLAKAGDIKSASGVWRNGQRRAGSSWLSDVFGENIGGIWQRFYQDYLQPLYYKVLTKPPSDFIDTLYDNSNLTGEHITSALLGNAQSQWRLTQDQQAVILSAAYPIYIDKQVYGAVVVEETTNGIRTLRNLALEKLFTALLAILLIGSSAFVLFASRISGRIVHLRNQADSAIDEQGRITGSIKASRVNDEIGDLSRSFESAINKLSQYNHYLENMSSRLSHELRTPIAVVKTSLENLQFLTMPDNASPYIERAQAGITRLSHMISQMSEATRVEQMLQNTEKQRFSMTKVVSSCSQGYQQIYPDFGFSFNHPDDDFYINGSPDHIAQLFDKVINNAVDFSVDKQINIALKQQKDSVCLTISNNGQLLPQDMQGQVFDSMVSLRPKHDTDITANIEQAPHLGLGLYIAKLICQFHLGEITASNHQNPDGVSISVKIPLAS